MKSSDIPDLTQKELLDAYFDAMKKTVDSAHNDIIPIINNGLFDLSDHEKAIVETFLQMHTLACSLTRLNNPMDFNAVAIIARSIFEVCIDLKLLTNATNEEVETFWAFPRIERFKKAEKIQQFESENSGIEENSLCNAQIRKEFVESLGRRNEIEQEVKKLWGDKNGRLCWPKNHWTGKSFMARTKSLGDKGYEYKYLEIYSFLSWYTHSGPTGYAGMSKESLEGVYGVSLNFARELYLEGLVLCANKIQLAKAIPNFFQIIDYMRNGPNQILINLGLRNVGE